MLTDLLALRAWVETGRGAPVFERYDQISWFIRLHHAELVASKTIIPGSGNRPTLVSPGFDNVVERILRRDAKVAS